MISKNNAGKKETGFWKKMFSTGEDELSPESEPTAIPALAEEVEPQVELPAMEEQDIAALEPEPISIPEHIFDDDPEPEPEPVLYPFQEDVLARAARLAAEEEEKQRLATVAVAEAARAEAASRRAGKEAALMLAEAKANELQIASAQAQAEASRALAALSEAQQSYTQAQTAAVQAEEDLALISSQGQAEMEQQREYYQARIAQAQQEKDSLAAEVEKCRAAAEAALKAGEESSLALEEAEVELRRINNEGSEEIRRALKRVEDAENETAAAAKHIENFEAQINSEQMSFDKAAHALADVSARRNAAREAVEELRSEENSILRDQQDDADALQRLIDEQTNRVEEERSRCAALAVERRDRADQLAEAAEQGESEKWAAEEHLRGLNLELSNVEREAKAKIAVLVKGIEQAKREVMAKKELYLDAQKVVEQATAALVTANALTKNANERAETARRDAKDAAVALDTAEKLKFDAQAAQGADEASAQLLNRAEQALISTIQRATEHLQEKRAISAAADKDAELKQKEADQAFTYSEQATAHANAMIVDWLAAEENLVNITNSVEAERSSIEKETAAAVADYQRRIAEAEEQVAQCRDRAAAAAETAEEGVQLWKSSRQALVQVEEQLAEMREAAQKETAQQQAEYNAKLTECRSRLAQAEQELRQLEQECDRLSEEHNQTIQVFGDKLQAYNEERERLHNELVLKQEATAALAEEADRLELSYKQEISRINQQIEASRLYSRDCRAQSVAQAQKVQDIQEAYDRAAREAAACQEEAEAALNAAELSLKQQVEPKQQQVDILREQVRKLALSLADSRSRAEATVSVAAQRFAERLAAVNEAALKRVEDEIARLKESSVQVYQEAESEKLLLEKAEAEYDRIQLEVDRLRAEEARITQESETKYQLICQEKDGVLSLLEGELAEHRRAELDKKDQADQAQQQLAQAEEELKRAAANLADEEQILDQVEKDAAERLRVLEWQYHEQIKAAESGRPQLLEKRDLEAQRLAAAEDEVLQRQQAYDSQMEAVAASREQELAWPEETERELNRVRDEQQAQINEISARLAAMEEREAELKEAYEKGSEYAQRSENAMLEVEQYLRRLQEEETEQRQAVEAEISAIGQRLDELRADADVKEASFRETEKLLINSSALIEAAESGAQDAQIATAKALAELQAAQAARETALSLAQQASASFGGMDKSTADIMQRAADDLFSAAENASALVEEKEERYQLSEEKLAQAQTELEQTRQAVGEAPAMLEECRQAWQLAEAEYSRYKDQAEQDIPAARNRLHAFLAQRRTDLSEAETKAAQCREEMDASRAAAEKLSRQLMDAAAEISTVAIQIQSAELACAEAVAEAKDQAELELARRKALRQEREAEGSRLLSELTASQAGAAEAKAAFAAAEAEYQQIDLDFRNAYNNLTSQYQVDCEQVQANLASARSRKDQAKAVYEAAIAQQEAASAVYASFCGELVELTRVREEKAGRCDELRLLKERMLSATEEEKLRDLGSSTIARMEFEEKLSRAAGERAAQRLLWAAAEKKAAELDAAIQAAEDKMLQIQQEGNKALNEAELTTASLMAQVEQS